MRTRLLYLLIILVHRVRVSCSRVMQILAPRYIFGLPNASSRKREQERVSELLLPSEISETLARRLEESRIYIPASFRGELVRRTIKKQCFQLPEWWLNDKAVGSSFALARGLNLPRIVQDRSPMKNIEFVPGTVIKRLSGSGGAGVYLYLQDSRIINMKTLERMGSVGDLVTDMSSYSRSSRDDLWRVEELISGRCGELAHDLKFYCFYGVVGLVLEVRRLPGLAYCWWMDAGSVAAVGKYDRQAFKGHGPTGEDMATASQLSSLIPAPFLRIDFLAGAEKLYFGEFTPRPGKFHQFNGPTDRKLGDLFIEAEARLERDLIRGHPFYDLFKNSA